MTDLSNNRTTTHSMTGAGSNLQSRVDEIQRNGSFPYFLLTDTPMTATVNELVDVKRYDNYRNGRTSALDFCCCSVVSV